MRTGLLFQMQGSMSGIGEVGTMGEWLATNLLIYRCLIIFLPICVRGH